MQPFGRSPAWAQRVLFGAVVVYFVSLVASIGLDLPALILFSNGLFGGIAIGVGALLYAEATETYSARTVAAVLLGLGGAVQLLWIGAAAVSAPLGGVDRVASLLVFGGIAAYVYAVRVAP